MKNVKKPIVIIVIIVILFLALNKISNDNEQKEIFKFVNDNYTNLEDIAKDFVDNKKPSYPKQIKSVKVYSKGTNNIVEFLYKSKKTGSNSKYFGFYYSKNDKPIAFKNKPLNLLELGNNTYIWEEKENKGKTIKIRNNWYYFEAE